MRSSWLRNLGEAANEELVGSEVKCVTLLLEGDPPCDLRGNSNCECPCFLRLASPEGHIHSTLLVILLSLVASEGSLLQQVHAAEVGLEAGEVQRAEDFVWYSV